ncbi:MAG: FAD-dependent oxidoreductase, partial [Bacillota bacterium]
MSAEVIKKAIAKKLPEAAVEVSVDAREIVTLRGNCKDWAQVVDAGHIAAKQKGVKNVVNKLTAGGKAAPQKDYSAFRAAGEQSGVVDEADVLIIGAGITGCGIARELSKYALKVVVVEMGDDVATGVTKANNGNIHPGHAEKSGTLKVRLNVEGNRLYTRWAEELGFTLRRCGAIGIVTHPLLKPALRLAYKKAIKNGVDGAVLVDRERACALEPGLVETGLGEKVQLALWLPTMGIVEPYQVAVALAENAAQNGVQFRFYCTVAGILRENGRVQGAVTNQGIIKAKYVINCAGLYADDISAMAGDECFTIHPRRGVIAILDKAKRPEYESICGHITMDDVKRALKKDNTKGGGMCRTPEGNILMGPSALEISDKEDLSTTPEELAYAMGRGDENIGYGDIIRFFAGNRPADYKEDFVIEASPVTAGFINVATIQSPGLAAAPAIAKMVEGILAEAAAKD